MNNEMIKGPALQNILERVYSRKESASKLVPYLNSKQKHQTYSNPTYIVHMFFEYATLDELKKQEVLFKNNIQDPIFRGLLFELNYVYPENKPFEKAKLLLDWGYDPKIIYDNANVSVSNGYLLIDSDMVGATALHVIENKKICDLLVKYGADVNARCSIYSALKEVVEGGIAEIKTSKDITLLKDKYHKHPKKKQILSKYFANMEVLQGNNKFSEFGRIYVKKYNEQLKLSTQTYTPYELAVVLNHRQKFLALKKYEPQEALLNVDKSEYDEIIESLNNKKEKKAARQIFNAMSRQNNYLLENLEGVKSLITPEFLFRTITKNYTIYIDKILQNKWVEKTGLDKQGQTYMEAAAHHNKASVFKLLNKYDYHEGMGATFDYLNAMMNNTWNNPGNPRAALQGMSITIIYVLADKGYRFDNQILLSYVIEKEKENLALELEQNIKKQEKVSLGNSNENVIKKKFKL